MLIVLGQSMAQVCLFLSGAWGLSLCVGGWSAVETAGEGGSCSNSAALGLAEGQMRILPRGRARICPCHSLRKRTGGVLPGLLGPRQWGLDFLTYSHHLCEFTRPEVLCFLLPSGNSLLQMSLPVPQVMTSTPPSRRASRMARYPVSDE